MVIIMTEANDRIVKEVTAKIKKAKRLGKGKPYRRKLDSAHDVKACLAMMIRKILETQDPDRAGSLAAVCNSFIAACRAESDEKDTKEILARLKAMERS